MSLPQDKQARKEHPITRGVLDYFPDAIAAVANVSYVGNEQHNPGEPMHWARDKSADHADCIARHLIERGDLDDDGLRHTAKVAWRALALLQTEIEEDVPVMYAPEQVIQELQEAAAKLDENAKSGLDKGPAPVYPDGMGFSDPVHDYADLMSECGIAKTVAEEILSGVTVPNPLADPHQFAYIAGPMRGLPELNFPAFFEAEGRMLHRGYIVVNPARIDHVQGDAHADLPPWHYARRDTAALLWLAVIPGQQAIAMLPGWEHSTGAVGEFFLARWLGLDILNAETGEALTTVNGDALLRSMIKTTGMDVDLPHMVYTKSS